MTTDTCEGPGGIVLELDRNDPDTPAMVVMGDYFASYDAAISTGLLATAGGNDERELTESQMNFLHRQGNQVDGVIEEARRGMKEYN